jgi:ADP-ribose pyrophosphatase YjhB (NUDIX family)
MVYRPSPDQVQLQRIRVAAAVVEAGRVLLAAHQFPGHPAAWLLPGGGAEPGETLLEAVAREMREETGLHIEVEKLLFWREFFDWRYSLEMIFLARPTGGQLCVGGDPEFDLQVIQEVAWFPLDDLAGVNIVPVVLRQRLPDAWRAGWKGHDSYLGLSESFAEVLRGWRPGDPPPA